MNDVSGETVSNLVSNQPVTSAEVVEFFTRSARASNELKNWQSDDRRKKVVPRILPHVNSILLHLTTKDVYGVARHTEHALGNVRKEDIKDISKVSDWHPNFAMTHVFGIVVEKLGYLPTYQDFRSACESEEFYEMLWGPAQDLISELINDGGVDPNVARGAMRWRVGNAYYSFIREALVLARMRERKLDAVSHPLADALFKTDIWVGNVAIELFMESKKYKSQEKTLNKQRKIKAREFLSDARPPLEFYDMVLPPATRYGVVKFPDRNTLEKAIDDVEKLVRMQEQRGDKLVRAFL